MQWCLAGVTCVLQVLLIVIQTEEWIIAEDQGGINICWFRFAGVIILTSVLIFS